MNSANDNERAKHYVRIGGAFAWALALALLLSPYTFYEQTDIIPVSTNTMMLPPLLFLSLLWLMTTTADCKANPLVLYFLCAVVFLGGIAAPGAELIDLSLLTIGLLACTIIFWPKETLERSALLFIRLMVVVSMVSLLTSFLLLIGIDLPFKRYERGSGYFILYFTGMGALTTNQWELPTGGLAMRAVGIFGEPGHFATMLILAITLLRCNLKRFETFVLLAAGISTFSSVFYILGAFIFFWFQGMRVTYLLSGTALMVAVLGLLLSFLPDGMQLRLFANIFGLISGDAVVERVIGSGFSSSGQSWVTMMGLREEKPMGSSLGEWVVKYGVFFWCAVMLLGITISMHNRDKRFSFAILLVLTALISHRAFYVLHFWVYIFLIYALRLPLIQNSEAPSRRFLLKVHHDSRSRELR